MSLLQPSFNFRCWVLLLGTACSHITENNKTPVTGDTLFLNQQTMVIRNKDGFDTLAQFVSMLYDTQFATNFQNVTPASKLDFSQYEFGKQFITRIKKGVIENGLNFAGHYSLVYWGCGSPCKLSAIVDLQTGKVYNGVSSETGYSFSPYSYILITNPPDSDGWYHKNIPWSIPKQFVWDGHQLKELKN